VGGLRGNDGVRHVGQQARAVGGESVVTSFGTNRDGGGPVASAARARVFINYRSNDAGWAVHLDNVLSERFGADRVFRASRSIQPGDDFIDRILSTVAASKVLVAVIGTGWLGATDRADGRALDSEHDWVRREIAQAFRQQLRVLPLLVDDAPPLRPEDLPEDIAQLARCQYLRVHYRAAQIDTQRVGDELVRLVPELATVGADARRRRWLHIGALLTVALLLAVALIWIMGDRSDSAPGPVGATFSSGAVSPTSPTSPTRPPWIALRPTEGGPTGVIQIRGAGFPPRQRITLNVSTENGWKDIGSPHTNEFGEFITSFDPSNSTAVAGRLAGGVHLIGTNSNDDPRLHTTARYTVIE
jgi:hypothetical protein